MVEKTLPFTKSELEEIVEKYDTPFHIYDEKIIRDNLRALKNAFSWNFGFKEFFAVKALPNPYILEICKEEGAGADCSSDPELTLSEKAGIVRENIMFSSNDTPAEEYIHARKIGAIINLDDISHIPFLEKHAGIPDLICFRYNPGKLREGNAIIGKPEEAKYGFTREQLFEGYKIMRDKGIKRFGLHTMIASNELNPQYFVDTGKMLFELIVDLSKKLNIEFEFANLGGGIGIPYKPEQQPVDLNKVGEGVKEAYDDMILGKGLSPLNIFMENGRMITGPAGFLVAKVRHIKSIYRDYIGLDACMANLMRPAIYGAYHHLTVLGKENLPHDYLYDVTGSLCENNDKFAIQRALPKIEIGDIIVIHDTGAHGWAMGFNYNGKLRSKELLLRKDGSIEMIRRAETEKDYFSTLSFPGSKFFNH